MLLSIITKSIAIVTSELENKLFPAIKSLTEKPIISPAAAIINL